MTFDCDHLSHAQIFYSTVYYLHTHRINCNFSYTAWVACTLFPHQKYRKHTVTQKPGTVALSVADFPTTHHYNLSHLQMCITPTKWQYQVCLKRKRFTVKQLQIGSCSWSARAKILISSWEVCVAIIIWMSFMNWLWWSIGFLIFKNKATLCSYLYAMHF